MVIESQPAAPELKPKPYKSNTKAPASTMVHDGFVELLEVPCSARQSSQHKAWTEEFGFGDFFLLAWPGSKALESGAVVVSQGLGSPFLEPGALSNQPGVPGPLNPKTYMGVEAQLFEA